MSLFYPSFDAIRLADQIFSAIGDRTPGYQERIGSGWYWQLPGGIIVVAALDYSVTPERWDAIRAQASTPRAGIFTTADFPFASYATAPSSPPFIHDMQGKAEWSNRLYFQMGHLIEDAVRWIGILHAIAISPQVTPPSSFPAISSLESKLVQYALQELEGHFVIKDLHEEFGDRISRRRLSALAQAWEARELLTKQPRRVTYALQVLATRDDPLTP
ncbi:MAG TPA: hypothetical protein ENN99_16365 [Chloroflexi bacterium]|nr:hypothetical protein [Chloroflexota bacterium]